MGVRVLPVLGPKGRTWRRSETALTITKKHKNTVAVVLGCYDVGQSIAVEVANDHLRSPFTHIKIAVGGRAKFSGAVTEAGLQVSSHCQEQVLVAIVIEVGDGEAIGVDWKRGTRCWNQCNICRSANTTGRTCNG